MRTRIVLIGMLLLCTAPLILAQRTTGEDLFQQGLDQERGKRDIPAAIKIYERIVKEFSSNRALVAKATLQLGICSEKLGDSKAREYYEQIVSKYGDQTDAVKDARARLSALRDSPDFPAAYPSIYIADIDPNSSQVRGTPVALPLYSNAGDEGPSWLPDGKSIVFLAMLGTSSRMIGRTIAVRSLEIGQVETHLSASGDVHVYNGLPVTRDGDLLLRESQVVNGRTESFLFRYNLQTRSRSQAATIPIPRIQGLAVTAHDDRTLYVGWADTTSQTERILPIDLNTGASKEMLPLPGKGIVRTIRISSDGRTLALIRGDKEDQVRIALVGVDGADYRELVTYKGGRGLAWTKDDRAILFGQSDDKDNWQLSRIGFDGGKPVFTGLEIKSLAGFDLSPDGQRIAFSGTAYRVDAPGVPPQGFAGGGRISSNTSKNSPTGSGPADPPALIVLWDAAASGNVQRAADAIKARADVDAMDTRTNANGRRPLHYAAERNDTAMINLLIAVGATVNATSTTRSTPLHFAAEAGANEAASLLITRGAALDLKNLADETPLEVAMRMGNGEVAGTLRDALKTPVSAKNLHLGVWKLNVEESKGWPYKTELILYAPDLNGFILMTGIQTTAGGQPAFIQSADREDGAFYPFYFTGALSRFLVTGVNQPHTQSTKIVDPYTAEISYKLDSGSTSQLIRTVSQDGKKMTVTYKTVIAPGQTNAVIAVYDRQ